MGFIDPMPIGDVSIRLQMDKLVDASNNVTADAYIGLPDLKIGLYKMNISKDRPLKHNTFVRWST